MRLLSMQCPVFCKLVVSIGCFPLYLLSIFQKMVQVAKAPFQTAPPKSGQTLNEDSSDLSFFPLLPLIRDRGNYKADGERKLEESTQFCRKPTVRHPALIPGIFTLFCVHGVCYGYSVMESAESVNIPFTIMRRRLMEGPQIVFYDNSCKLHSYCLNRDPLFFKSTWFLVDRLHWKNHTACNIGYNADMYPQLHGKNTQVAEQYNARIKKMKHHLPYMTKEHFMKHMELYLWYHSRNIIRKMHCSGV